MLYCGLDLHKRTVAIGPHRAVCECTSMWLAKELATIVYAMLSMGEPFNKHFHGRAVVTTKRCTWPRLANPPA
jgi:hypothetical protein